MGLDDILNKANELADQHGDKIKEGLTKAADLVDEKTGGQHSGLIDTAEQKAGEVVDNMQNDNV